jgi:lipopolysaccharide/colanic/teichoic acid biosynthesis glycosyltransferase
LSNSFAAAPCADPLRRVQIPEVGTPSGSRAFWVSKRLFDVVIAILGLPIVALIGVGLLVLNPVWNRGPLLYSQVRMGRDCRPFTVWKFRSMRPDREARGPEDPLETDRITPLGAWLRRTRLDETPQLANVLLGEMSLIGPRPDTLDHASRYIETVPDYESRHCLRPGLSGLAQVEMGYAEGSDMAAAKTRYDLAYIERAGWRMETTLVWRTMVVLATGFGAR